MRPSGLDQVGVGRGDAEDYVGGLGNVLGGHVANQFLDVFGLVANGKLHKSRKVDKCEREDVGREDA